MTDISNSTLPNAPVNRRQFLAAAGATATIGIAGCSGEETEKTDGDDGPDPPWTTEELADHIEAGTEITIYNGYQNPTPYEQLIEVINDEYGTTLEPTVFATDGGEVSQRIIQERQADRDQSDIISVATDLMDMIHQEGREAEGEYFELGIDEDYWFSDELEGPYLERWYASLFNGGPSLAMPVNPDVFDEMGISYPNTWNELFDDVYEDVRITLPRYIVRRHLGWIIDYHAEQRGMENMAWMESLMDHMTFEGVDSYSSGTRDVGEGNAPFMFFNFPWVITRFTADFPVETHFPDVVPRFMSSGTLSINNRAPNPWAARFVLSATAEPVIQRSILNEVDDFTPGRIDIDYSAEEMDPETRATLEADPILVSFWDELDFSAVGQQAAEDLIAL